MSGLAMLAKIISLIALLRVLVITESPFLCAGMFIFLDIR